MASLKFLNLLKHISLVLIIVGALNWGLVGALNFDLVKWIGKQTAPVVATVVYILVGLAAIVYTALKLAGMHKTENFHNAPPTQSSDKKQPTPPSPSAHGP